MLYQIRVTRRPVFPIQSRIYKQVQLQISKIGRVHACVVHPIPYSTLRNLITLIIHYSCRQYVTAEMCVFISVCLCCVSKSINTNPAVVLSHESAITLQIQLPTQSHPPGYPSSPTLHYSLFFTPHFFSLVQAPPPSARLQRTFSPVVIRLLAENSFRERVTSLPAREMRKGGREHLQTKNITRKPQLTVENVRFYSLRDLSNMFVPQIHPKVIIFMQKHFLLF